MKAPYEVLIRGNEAWTFVGMIHTFTSAPQQTLGKEH